MTKNMEGRLELRELFAMHTSPEILLVSLILFYSLLLMHLPILFRSSLHPLYIYVFLCLLFASFFFILLALVNARLKKLLR